MVETAGNYKRLFLLDTMSLVFRGYYVFVKNPLRTKTGLNTSAIFGFMNILTELLNREQPTYIAAIMESREPVVREQVFKDYKAHRPPPPEPVRIAIPYIDNLLDALGIEKVEVSGWEADDVMASLAVRAATEGFTVYMVTSDKDMEQIVSDRIFIYKPARESTARYEKVGVKEVREKWGVKEPAQVADVLALMGDSVDGVPGVPGIGEKRAKELIGQFGSVEGVYENLHLLSGTLRATLERHRQEAFLSKKLTVLACHLPVEWAPERFRRKPMNRQRVRELLAELEFKSIARRLLGEELQPVKLALFSEQVPSAHIHQTIQQTFTVAPTPRPQTIATLHTVSHTYLLVTTDEQLQAVLRQMEGATRISMDVETSSTNPHLAQLAGISLSWEPFHACYIPFAGDEEWQATVRERLGRLLTDPSVEKVGQNVKYDVVVLRWHGFEVCGPFFDTMVADWLLNPEERHNMDALALRYLNYKPIPISAVIGERSAGQLTMLDLPPEKIKDYACEDADVTLRLYEPLRKELIAAHLWKLFSEVEMPLLEVLADMELTGVAVDREWLRQYDVELAEEMQALEEEIYRLADTRFNIASQQQLANVLFVRLGIEHGGKRTPTGQLSTSSLVLEKLVDKHPIIRKVLEWREVQKLKSTYVTSLLELIHPRTGRIHTIFNQTGTATGRLSSSSPNLQNIPIRTEKGQRLRRAFIAGSDEYLLCSLDYSQIELRIIASFSGDEALIEAFRNGRDIHTETAMRLFGVSEKEVSPAMRRLAKSVNFGIIYGISAHGLAQQLNISRSEAQKLIDRYFTTYRKVKQYIDTVVEEARQKGYVRTMLGRRRFLPNINSPNPALRAYAERNAINTPIQGTASDIIKVAMVHIHRWLKQNGCRTRLLVQIHDELLFELHRSEQEIVPHLKHLMETAFPLEVPVVVEAGIGTSWLEAHS